MRTFKTGINRRPDKSAPSLQTEDARRRRLPSSASFRSSRSQVPTGLTAEPPGCRPSHPDGPIKPFRRRELMGVHFAISSAAVSRRRRLDACARRTVVARQFCPSGGQVIPDGLINSLKSTIGRRHLLDSTARTPVGEERQLFAGER